MSREELWGLLVNKARTLVDPNTAQDAKALTTSNEAIAEVVAKVPTGGASTTKAGVGDTPNPAETAAKQPTGRGKYPDLFDGLPLMSKIAECRSKDDAIRFIRDDLSIPVDMILALEAGDLKKFLGV